MHLLWIGLSLFWGRFRSRDAQAQSGMSAEADSQAERRVADSGLDCGGDPATRGIDHTLAESRGNGLRFTSTGSNGDGETGARELKRGRIGDKVIGGCYSAF